MQVTSVWRFGRVLLAGSALALCLARTGRASAEQLNVAVAANFLSTLQRLSPVFERACGHKLLASPGSSGQLYAQIRRGAPYEVLLSADRERPAKLEADGLVTPGSLFTFAIGQLVLWSAKPALVEPGAAALERSDVRFVALADPKTAPYGAAAEQVLRALDLLAPLKAADKLVYGQSVGQAHQFATSGHADCAFVARSQVIAADGSGRLEGKGSQWLVPQSLYAPLEQAAAIMRASPRQRLAKQFLDWLREDPEALQIIRASGYALPRR